MAFFLVKMNSLKRGASVPADIWALFPPLSGGHEAVWRGSGNLKDERVLSYNRDLSPTF
jgi:hypothetical protein